MGVLCGLVLRTGRSVILLSGWFIVCNFFLLQASLDMVKKLYKSWYKIKNHTTPSYVFSFCTRFLTYSSSRLLFIYMG